MVGPCVPFPARGGFFGVGRSETFQTLSLSLKTFSRCAGLKVQKFSKKKAYTLNNFSRCAGLKVKKFYKKGLYIENNFPLRGLKS